MRPLIALLLLMPSSAWAHAARFHTGAPGWTWDPWIVVPLLAALLSFGLGWVRLEKRSTRGHAGLRRRSLLFAAGWLTLAGSLLSPLHEAGERSFAAHMVEHELLMLLAAPLLALSRPLSIMLWAFPAGGRQALGRFGLALQPPWVWLTAPLTATALQAAALWLWHAPPLFDRALSNEGWHAAQHLSFVITALLFWTAMVGRHTAPGARRAVAALCLFATSVISGALGALMAFASSPWYAGYAHLGMAPFGLTPAEDQQVAGLIMWVPGGLVHAAVALLMVKTLLKPAAEASDAV